MVRVRRLGRQSQTEEDERRREDISRGFKAVGKDGKAEKLIADNRYVRFGGSVAFGWLSNDFDDSGVIGDPTAADADHGKVLFEGAVEAFASALAEISTFRFRP